MLTICLSRTGKKNQPHFRVVVKERAKDPWGKAVDIVGYYNPRTKPRMIELKKDRIEYWLKNGAQPSPTIANILINEGILKQKKKKSVKLSKKRREKLEKKKEAK